MNKINVLIGSALLVVASTAARSQSLADIQDRLDRIESNAAHRALADANADMQDAREAATRQFNLLMEQYARSTYELAVTRRRSGR